MKISRDVIQRERSEGKKIRLSCFTAAPEPCIVFAPLDLGERVFDSRHHADVKQVDGSVDGACAAHLEKIIVLV